MTSGVSTGSTTASSVGAARRPATIPASGGASLRAVVEELERQLEPVRALADREPLVARLAEHAPGPLGERLAAEPGERLRRAEARARAADEQDARQARTRHGSV